MKYYNKRANLCLLKVACQVCQYTPELKEFTEKKIDININEIKIAVYQHIAFVFPEPSKKQSKKNLHKRYKMDRDPFYIYGDLKRPF